MTAKTAVQGIKGRKQTYHAVYDFSVDGGTFTGTTDLFDLKADTIIHSVWYEVETAAASAGAATIDVGITGGDVDGIFTQAAYTVYAANAVSTDALEGALVSAQLYKVTAATTISMLIGTADLTAGKIHFYVDASCGY